MSLFDDDRVQRLITSTSRRISNLHRGYVEADDLRQVICEWLLRHQEKAAEYVADGQRGWGKLSRSVERAAHEYVADERVSRTGAERGDTVFYNAGMVEDLLPDVWYYSTWVTSGQPENEDAPRRKTSPAEGNNRLAALVDVSNAIRSLSPEDQSFLRLRWCDGGNTWDEVGLFYGTSGEAARRKGQRIVNRLIDRLGGPNPWWSPSRHSRSNASAQSELRRQAG